MNKPPMSKQPLSNQPLSAQPLNIPIDLLPADGRFGSGPSKVRAEQVDRLAALGRPEVTVVEIPNAGHNANQDNPDFFNSTMMPFLASLPDPS